MSNIEIFEKNFNLNGRKDLPRVIDTPYPFVVIEDLDPVSKRIAPCFPKDIQIFQNGISSILKKNMPDGSTFFAASADDINLKIEEKIKAEIDDPNKNVGIVNLDRYLCANIKTDRVFPVNISRGIDGKLTARPGETMSPDDQIRNLVKWIKNRKFQNVIVTDDVLAVGETLIPFITNMKKELPNVNIKIIVGLASSGGSWSGIENVASATGITPEFITLIKASQETKLTSGMAIPTSRDFTFLGGKISQSNEGPVAYPYFLPFSIPVASFMPQENQINCSRNLLTLNILYQHIWAEF